MPKYVGIIAALAAVCFIAPHFMDFSAKEAGARVLQVNSVGADPGAYIGEITITGVKRFVAKQDANVFGIMDLQELECTAQECNMMVIPVKFDGQPPAMGDEVVVTGRFVKDGDTHIFLATAVEVLRNHTIGG